MYFFSSVFVVETIRIFDWEVSSVGRASDLHSEGQRFESFTSHHFGGVAQFG